MSVDVVDLFRARRKRYRPEVGRERLVNQTMGAEHCPVYSLIVVVKSHHARVDGHCRDDLVDVGAEMDGNVMVREHPSFAKSTIPGRLRK